jgi:hypothetical protein
MASDMGCRGSPRSFSPGHIIFPRVQQLCAFTCFNSAVLVSMVSYSE